MSKHAIKNEVLTTFTMIFDSNKTYSIMITFLICLSLLIIGYFTYGKFIARFFGATDTKITPAMRMADGVDYFPMPTWKIFTIEFLNIAGLGPIFGAILGAMYGPMAYIWIVFGCIFMGGVHDYFAGMLSIRNDGASLPEIVGKYMGSFFLQLLRIFSIILLIFVGVAFVTGPAGLLNSLTSESLHNLTSKLPFSNETQNVISSHLWFYLIFAYYLIATLLPINKIIGKIYPAFGAALLLMAFMISGALLIKGFNGSIPFPEISWSELKNLHKDPLHNILFPMLFVVISCGAISGFHSTQAPLMARCLKKESHGRQAFYGSMIAEGIVALIWATAAIVFFHGTEGLNTTLSAEHNPAWVVNTICTTWLGKIGAIFAIIGVVACPITTGDTAFRSVRLMFADIFRLPQKSIKNRLIISIPLFVVGFFLTQIDFSTIWKYVGISNQLLSMLFLWTAATYLVKVSKNHLYLSIPALFMTAVCFTYLLIAPNKAGGLALPHALSYTLGIGLAVCCFCFFLWFARKNKGTMLHQEVQS